MSSNIKIYIDTQVLETGRPNVMFAYMKDSLWRRLERRGVFRVDNEADADFILTSDYDIKVSGEIKDNLIVVDSSDGCHFGSRYKRMDNTNIFTWVKRYRVEDYTRWGTHIPRCLFSKELGVESPPESEIRALPKRLDKVVTGLSFLYHDNVQYRHRRISELHPIDGERDIDVFFAGTTHYCAGQEQTWKEQLVSGHRQSCLAAIEQLDGLNTVMMDSKAVAFEDYVALLKRSKLVISPWGYGEACFRDYEPLFYGCDVIKPQTSYRILSYPDLFAEPHTDWFSWVQPDWSNLGQVVREQLSSWDHRRDARLALKRALFDSLSYDYQVDIMMDIFEHAALMKKKYLQEKNVEIEKLQA